MGIDSVAFQAEDMQCSSSRITWPTSGSRETEQSCRVVQHVGDWVGLLACIFIPIHVELLETSQRLWGRIFSIALESMIKVHTWVPHLMRWMCSLLGWPCHLLSHFRSVGPIGKSVEVHLDYIRLCGKTQSTVGCTIHWGGSWTVDEGVYWTVSLHTSISLCYWQ